MLCGKNPQALFKTPRFKMDWNRQVGDKKPSTDTHSKNAQVRPFETVEMSDVYCTAVSTTLFEHSK